MSKRRNTIYIFLFLFVLIVIPFSIRAENNPVELRIIKVRVAADQEFRKRTDWQNILRKRMKAVSDIFEKNFKIRFDVVDMARWDLLASSKPYNTHGLSDSLIANVPLAGAEMLIGFSGIEPKDDSRGVGTHYAQYAVITDSGNENGQKEQAVVLVTVHEILHLFGMFHVANKNSIMYLESGTLIDDYTLRHMRLMRLFDFNKGMDSLDKDTIKKSYAIFEEGVIPEQKHVPPLAAAHQKLGWDLERKGKLDEAIKEYREAFALGEQNETTLQVDLGRTLLKKGQSNEALGYARKAVSLDAKNDDAHDILAGILTAQGKHEEALVERREAVRLKPDNADYRTALGRTLMTLGKIDEAVTQFQSAIKADADNINPHYQLGLAYNRLKKYPEAVAEFREMIRRAPQIPDPYLQSGVILLFYMQKPGEAATEFRELVRLKPNDAMSHFYLGTALYNITGKTDEAIAEFREAVRLDPNNATAKSYLDGALKARGAVAPTR